MITKTITKVVCLGTTASGVIEKKAGRAVVPPVTITVTCDGTGEPTSFNWPEVDTSPETLARIAKALEDLSHNHRWVCADHGYYTAADGYGEKNSYACPFCPPRGEK